MKSRQAFIQGILGEKQLLGWRTNIHQKRMTLIQKPDKKLNNSHPSERKREANQRKATASCSKSPSISETLGAAQVEPVRK